MELGSIPDTRRERRSQPTTGSVDEKLLRRDIGPASPLDGADGTHAEGRAGRSAVAWVFAFMSSFFWGRQTRNLIFKMLFMKAPGSEERAYANIGFLQSLYFHCLC